MNEEYILMLKKIIWQKKSESCLIDDFKENFGIDLINSTIFQNFSKSEDLKIRLFSRLVSKENYEQVYNDINQFIYDNDCGSCKFEICFNEKTYIISSIEDLCLYWSETDILD